MNLQGLFAAIVALIVCVPIYAIVRSSRSEGESWNDRMNADVAGRRGRGKDGFFVPPGDGTPSQSSSSSSHASTDASCDAGAGACSGD